MPDSLSLPPVAILCGGRGTRLQEHTRELPKPLVEIGGEPIVGHVIGLYAAQGFQRFLLATGYKGELIDAYTRARSWPPGVTVQCVDTGPDTPTGGRLKLLQDELSGQERFCATYADGLADIDLIALLAHHKEPHHEEPHHEEPHHEGAHHEGHRPLATMTVVRPELQFGITELDDSGRVSGFREKPRSQDWVNGGFFCFELPVLSRLSPESVLERQPLERLAADGELRAYRHEGFWECMDTYKDAVALNDLWHSGEAPWAGVRGATQNHRGWSSLA